MPTAWAAARFARHPCTISRWRARGFPPAVPALAALELEGELGRIHAAWHGWRLDPKTGELRAPGNAYVITVGQVAAVPIYREQIAALEYARRRRPLARRILRAIGTLRRGVAAALAAARAAALE